MGDHQQQDEQHGRPQAWTVGDVTVAAVVEAETPGVPAHFFFPAATAEAVQATDWLTDDIASADGRLTFRVQAFLIRMPGLTVLVDPCVGNGKRRALPFWNDLHLPWLQRLAAAGAMPDDIDLVVHTHLHEDHVGWDTTFDGERWVPTFTRARHVYVDTELDHRRSQTGADHPDPDGDVYADSIAPVFAAGLAETVPADADLGAFANGRGLRLIPTPGHTPGHVSLRVETGGEPFVITGDLLHHQCQLSHPDWAEVADADPRQALSTRADFFSHHARHGTLLGGTHFASEPVGRIEAHGRAWRFRPEATSVAS